MSDLMRDIDDAMRVEKLTRLWNEHKVAVISGVAALIIGTASHAGWNSWQASQKRENTSALLAALDEEKPLPALEKLAKDGTGNHPALTLMIAAAHALAEKKYDDALDLYKQVLADRSAPPMLRDLAVIQSVNIGIDQPATTADDLLTQIGPVADSAKSPWQGQALFTRAAVKAYKGKDFKGAIGDLELVTSKQTLPSSLRQRARALIDMYRLEGES